MTVKEFRKAKRKAARQELKAIEEHLHPEPEPLNGCQVCHEHVGRFIIFTAWIGDRQSNTKQLKFNRQAILADTHFYNHNLDEFKWLCA